MHELDTEPTAHMIGKNLLRLRMDKNWKQEYVAEQLGVKQNTYSRYETGEVIPKLDVLKRAAELYNVPEQQLLYGECITVTQNNHDQATGTSCYMIHNHVPGEVVDKLMKQYDERIGNLEALVRRLMDMLERQRAGK